MSSMRVPIIEKILDANDQVAAMNQQLLTSKKVYSINLMASPGAGKTSLILETIRVLREFSSKDACFLSLLRIGVIEGDTAPVTIDADKVLAVGMPAVQINTGGNCHLDAIMVRQGMEKLPLDQLDLVIVENVGNLVCPAAFKLGTHANVLIASIPEGDDKPYKYPNIYRNLDVLIVNKIDLLPYIPFDMDYFRQGVEILNPGLLTFPVSAKTGEGIHAWVSWLTQRVRDLKKNDR